VYSLGTKFTSHVLVKLLSEVALEKLFIDAKKLLLIFLATAPIAHDPDDDLSSRTRAKAQRERDIKVANEIESVCE